MAPDPDGLSALMAQPLGLMFRFSCVGAQVVIFRIQWGGEESSRWGERARSPNEVSLVAPGVKKTRLFPPPLLQL